MSSIGDRVRQLRELRGLKQGELAERLGIKQPSLSQIENGRTQSVKGATLDALCIELATTPDYLLRGTDSHSSHESLELAAMEAELLHILRSLPPERRISLMEYARFIKTGAPPVHSKTTPAKVKPLPKRA